MKMKHTLSIAVSAALMSMSVHSAEQFAGGLSSFDISPDLLKGVEATSINKTKNIKPILGAKAPKFVVEKDLIQKPYVYIVTLTDDSVASYDGTIKGLAATNPKKQSSVFTASVAQPKSAKLNPKSKEVQAYVAYLDGQQTSFMNRATKAVNGLKVMEQYKFALNGMAVKVTPDEAEALSKLPGVARVVRESTYKLNTDVGPVKIGAPRIWDGSVTNSGVGVLGAGIIIGTVDSGINSDSRSFADIGDDGYDHTNPLGEGVYIGDCEVEFPEMCNDKLIGVRSYDQITDVYSDTNVFPPGLPQNGEDYSGHGSHTAGTSGGNILRNVPVLTPGAGEESDGIPGPFSFEQISGVAPHANVIAYQICYPGRSDAGDTYGDCPGAAILAGINDAIQDGVDVINYSISGGNFPWTNDVELAFLAARNAGIFVATSAGNSGPNAGTTSKHAPWYTAVAASTHGREITYSKEIGNFTGGDTELGTLTGSNNSLGITASIVYAADFPNENDPEGDPAQCLQPYPAGTFSGEIVLCDRGAIARVQKAENAAAGGAGGFVLGNVSVGSVDNDTYVIPGIHIGFENAELLRAWLASGTDHMATITPSEGELVIGAGDDLAGFSSRGPNQSISTLSPQVAAPGVSIYAASADQKFGHDGHIADPSDFDFLSGTSMASPHVAGAAALLMAANPTWNPDNVRSALMMTATTNMRKEDGTTAADWFDMGAGRIQVDQANLTGLIMNETGENYLAANPTDGGDPRTLNIPSMVDDTCVGACSWTRTVTATKDGSWTVSGASISDGVSISVSPESFDIVAGASQEITVTASASGSSEEFLFARLDLTSPSSPDLHMPIAVVASSSNLPEAVEIVADRDADTFVIADIVSVALPEVTIRSYGLTKATNTAGNVGQDSDNGSIFDNAADGLFIVPVTVPANAKYIAAEITTAESPDLDLFIVRDANGNGAPDAGEIIASAATFSSLEKTTVVTPQAGAYLIVVQNWTASAPDASDAFTLATAVVDGELSDGLTFDAPGSVASAEPFDIRIGWDIDAVEGDRYFGAFDVGSTSATPGDFGLVTIDLTKGESDVQILGGSESLLEPGQQITYGVLVSEHFKDEDRNYEITLDLPEGVSLVEGSLSDGGLVEDGTLTWNILQETLKGKAPSYTASTPATDAFCANPNFGQGGGYLDLAGFGIGFSGVDGDTVTGNFNSPVAFLGQLYPGFTATDDGFITVNGNAGSTPWINQLMPDEAAANGVIAPFWRDMVIDNATGSGLTIATAGPRITIIEWDNMSPFGSTTGDILDFQIVVINEPAGNEPNIVFSYGDVTHEAESTFGTSIGYEAPDGKSGLTTHYRGAAGTIGDIEADVVSGAQLCLRLQDPSNEKLLTFTVEVNADNKGGAIELVAMSSLPSNIGTKTEATPVNDNAAVVIQGDWDLDNDVDLNDVRALTRAVQLGQEVSMRFDLNDDGAVNYTDVRLLQGLCTRTRCAL